MIKFRDLAVKYKLTIIIMLSSTLAVLFVGTITIGFSYYVSRNTLIQDLSGLAQIIGNNCSAAIAFNIPEDAERTLKAFKSVFTPFENRYPWQVSGKVT